MGVLLISSGKLRLCPTYSGLEIRSTNRLVLRGPEVSQNLSELSGDVTPGLTVLVVDVLQITPRYKIVGQRWRI